MKKLLFVILILAATSSMNLRAGESNANIRDKIDNIMQWEEKFGFSGSVLVVKDGDVILSKGYGMANAHAVFPNTPKTAFYIASISKPITALAVMKLVEENKIKLSDHISKYFTNVPENKKDITVEMLLTHTSGLENTYSCDNISDRTEAIETIMTGTPVISAPGEEYNYSGDNYSLLAALIEIVSGYKFERYVTEKILEPSGIETPAFIGKLELLNHEDIATPSENSNVKDLREIKSTWGRKGRSGLILSVEDLYKLDLAITEHKLFDESFTNNILSPKIKNASGYNYGYGFQVGKTAKGKKVFGHGGDDDGIGHNAVYLDYPDDNVKIFIASNSGLYSETSWADVISSLIEKVLFESEYVYRSEELFYNEFQKSNANDLEKYEGVYQSENIFYHVWINKDGQLILSPVGDDYAKSFSFSDAYTEKNSLVKNILEETYEGKFELLNSYSNDAQSFDKLKNQFSGLWQSLEKKNGKLERIDILGTANIWSGNYQSDIATWFKLIFENKTQVYRFEWNANDKIAGLGGSRIPYPMMFTMNQIAENEFIGFDPANGKAIAVNFWSYDKGNTMEVNFADTKGLILRNTGELKSLPVRSAAETVYYLVITEGIDAGLKEFANIKESKTDRFSIDEGELNEVGYRLMREKKFNESIAVLTIAVQEFPESANAFDSLGEAHMKAGNTLEAIKNYTRSLELDPENNNAKKMIEELSK